MTLDEQFKDAQQRVKGLKARPDNDTLLKLYALYKQGSEGDAKGSRPGMFDPVGRAKFDAWAGKKGTAQEAAKAAYVALVDGLVKG